VRFLSLRNNWFNVAVVLAVSAANAYAIGHHQPWGDWLATALFGFYAIYCAQNFVRCREVHCAITAPGFLAAAALMALRLTGVGHYDYGLPWLVFVASAGVGFCIEWIYESRTGSSFLKD
jgi:hypothetical protein